MFAILLSDKMDPFYQNITSFPTALFSLLLVLLIFYWLSASLGFVDLDVLDIDMPEGADLDEVTTPEALAGLLFKFGLYGVPLTIILTFVALFGWTISYFLVYFLFDFIPSGIFTYLAGIPALLVSLYIAVMITAQVIKPLRPLFREATKHSVKEVLGQTAIVRTSRVDNEFGEIFLADGGAGLIFKARSTGDDVFKKGDRVVLLEYMDAENHYRVISEKDFTN